MGIIYLKQDLFAAPKGSLLAHACNCKGVWGSGVAVGFKEHCPEAYKQYNQYCTEGSEFDDILGSCLLIENPKDDFRVGCLMTSDNYGFLRDTNEEILKATETAFRALLLKCSRKGIKEIWIPKINSGLFAVPWESTYEVILKCLKEYPNVVLTICSLEM